MDRLTQISELPMTFFLWETYGPNRPIRFVTSGSIEELRKLRDEILEERLFASIGDDGQSNSTDTVFEITSKGTHNEYQEFLWNQASQFRDSDF